METLEEREKFIELRAKGLSFDKIAAELHKAKQTLVNWDKEYKEEIANLKAEELEALQERYYLTKERKIKLFGERLEAINKELAKRDLSDVSTDKLLDLLIKCHAAIENEMIEPRFHSEEEIKVKREEMTLLKTVSRL